MLATLLIPVLLHGFLDPQPSAARPVPWEEVRLAVGQAICTQSYRLPDGSEVYVSLYGEREACGAPEADSPLARAVDRAFADAAILLSSVRPDGTDAIEAGQISLDERTRSVREAYLGSEEFLRFLLPRLRTALAAEGLECSACPIFAPRAVRRVSWQELRPYVVAHFWPDPVRTPSDDARKAGENISYGMHICSGLNGISRIEDPDAALVRAGFLGAFHSPEAKALASAHFHEILGEQAFLDLSEDASRTEYLRKHLAEELTRDEKLRIAVCETLGSLAPDLALEVDGCEGGR